MSWCSDVGGVSFFWQCDWLRRRFLAVVLATLRECVRRSVSCADALVLENVPNSECLFPHLLFFFTSVFKERVYPEMKIFDKIKPHNNTDISPYEFYFSIVSIFYRSLRSVQVLHQQAFPILGPPPESARSAVVILEQKVSCLMTYTTRFRLSKYAFLLA